MMVDIQTLSIAIASTSVVAGVVYYVLQIRHQTKLRQTDLVMSYTRLTIVWNFWKLGIQSFLRNSRTTMTPLKSLVASDI